MVANGWVNAGYKHLIHGVLRGAANAVAGRFFHLLCPTVGKGEAHLRGCLACIRVVTGKGKRTDASMMRAAAA